MSPLEIMVALHHIVCVAPYHCPSPAYDEAVIRLCQNGILKFEHAWGGDVVGTAKGRAWKELICATPFPVAVWVDPRRGAPEK